MELLQNVLIKEVDGKREGDKVVYIDNLPMSLLYQKTKKMVIDRHDPLGRQHIVPDYKIVNGQRVLTGEMVYELLPGIERSQTGDEAFVFFTNYNEAKERLSAIDRHVRESLPVAERIQERIPYALQPGVMTSAPRPLNTIPHILLPAPVSPPSKDVQERTDVAVLKEPAKKSRKPWTEAQKEEARKRMAKAREVRRAQQVGDIKA